MKEPKVEKVQELKLQIEELEERIAPGATLQLVHDPPGIGFGIQLPSAAETALFSAAQASPVVEYYC